MTKEELIKRNKNLAIRVVNMISTLPKGMVSDVFGRQLIRSITSVGANYRAACRAKSKSDFVYKLKIVEEELDESIYWMELIQECVKNFDYRLVNILIQEADELLAIYISSIKTARINQANTSKSKIESPKSKIQNRR